MKIKHTLSLMILLGCLSIQSYSKNCVTADHLAVIQHQDSITEDTMLPEGSTVYTTLNANAQNAVDVILRQSMEKYDAISGTAMVIETQTGEIVAMSNLGKNSNGGYAEDFNYAIADNLEQGQLFTLVPLIALLENNSATLETKVDVQGGTVNISGVRVNDYQKSAYNELSLRECFAYSSNVGFAMLVQKYYKDNPKEFITSIHKLGITGVSGFQLEGEREPFVKNVTDKNWRELDLVTMSYGYSTQFTALRMLMLYNAVANSGKLITPYLLKEIRDDNDNVMMSFSANVLNEKICSDKTLNQLQTALEDINDRSAIKYLFKDRDYTIAGKMGTAIVSSNGRYIPEEGRQYLASFVGYFPADNPKYSCIVQIKTFKSHSEIKPYMGAELAAPAFIDIADYMMNSQTK